MLVESRRKPQRRFRFNAKKKVMQHIMKKGAEQVVAGRRKSVGRTASRAF